MCTMDKTLNELVANVSKSKMLAKDVYFRTMSRQTINRVYDAVGAKLKLEKTTDSGSINPESQKTTDQVCERAIICDQLKFKAPKASKSDDAMKCRFDKTFIKMTEHMNGISKECKCFYKSCPKRSLSRAERQHFAAYHSKKSQKSPERKTKKDSSNASSSGNKSDSSTANSFVTQSDSQKTPRKMDKTKSGRGKLTAKDSLSLSMYNKNSSHSMEETELAPEFYPSPPYCNTVSGAYGNHVTFSRLPSATCAFTSKLHPTFVVAASSSDESTSTEASDDGKKSLLLHTKLLKERAEKTAKAAHETKQRNQSFLPKFSWEKATPKKQLAGISLSSGSTHLAGQGLHARDVKQRRVPVMNTASTEQGICILTKPGQYIVRKPVEGSGKKLFHVQPGQFISLNLSDLDSR